MANLPPINDKTALLIIDVQQVFLNEYTNHLPAEVTLLQSRYKTVIATRFYNENASAFRTLMDWHRFSRGTAETELAFEVAPHAKVIDKATYSAVTPACLRELESNQIETVHLCGCDTNMCVTQSAVDLFETNKYRPVILVPYCASHSGAEYHDYALKLLEKSVGQEQIWNPA